MSVTSRLQNPLVGDVNLSDDNPGDPFCHSGSTSLHSSAGWGGKGTASQGADGDKRKWKPCRGVTTAGKRRRTRRYTRKPKLDTLLTKLVRCTKVYKMACDHGRREQHDYIEVGKMRRQWR